MEPINSAGAPKSYLDFDGLGQLKAQAHQDAKSAMRQTAQQFEALFLQMMMKSMREASIKDDDAQSSGKETFEGMFDREVSVQMAKRNTLGLADMLVKHMPQPPSTAAVLEARGAGGPAPMALDNAAAGRAMSLKAQLPNALPLPRAAGIPLPSTKMLLDGSRP